MTASVDFRFDSTLVNPNEPQSPIRLSFSPNADGNHAVSAYVDPYFSPPLLNIGSYAWVASNEWGTPAELNFENNWYRLTFTVTIVGGTFGDQISVRAEIFNLGVAGNSPPQSIGITQGTIYDDVFAADPKISLKLEGTRWGGARYHDNFRFTGPTADDTSGQPQRFAAQIERAVKVSWNTQLGKIYTIEWSPDMTAGSWQVLSSDYVGTGDSMDIFDVIEATQRRFYRVKEQ